ncbi:fucose permease [Saccharopolyspora erythraea NRRL 2338]|uniref:Amino acid ABC transporter, permease protein,putative n=2 Tax=Saccharopolyspora erythraea TaxID=1836 RepID=A4FBL5_SACEN|nr:MFS transporter [Saccharopolyspora erythraea]EQD87485.1 major facilitator transporter [Saccharopolyspora erythraea D]PFG95218.1 fucose permease [Saccharopolyspora erythraea NRRL 2338]QRK91877.1 MFS transporter [Saccharopolyspora erythraea]CAM01440.1 amino acid ABC transporter, permease protein,putative [Saccharopolyspora erythraea NRRL 2338]
MSETLAAARPVRAEQRARWACTTYFVLTGLTLATWTARIPAVKGDLRLDDAQITIALFALAAGTVLAMQFVGRLADRFGSARVMVPAGVLLGLTTAVLGLAWNAPTLLAGLLLLGVWHGTVDVTMNAHAVEVQRHYGRPIMGSFHGMFSVGGLLGAGLGALAAHFQLTAATNFLVVGIAVTVLAAVTGRALLPAEEHPPQEKPSTSRGVPAAILFLGALGFFCSVGEGSVADWSPLYLHDTLHTSAAVAPIGYAVFSVTMAVFRFLGDRMSTLFGPVVLVRCCGLVAGIGLGTALLLHHPVAAIIGFGLFGVGLSCIVPQVFSAAGNRDPQRRARDLAQVSTLSYGGLMAGPVFIGLVAQGFGLAVGLAIPAVLALLVALSAPAVRPRRAG